MTTGVGEGGASSSDSFPFDDNILDDSVLSDLISEEEITVGTNKKPRTFFIPSREFGITGSDEADILITAREIRNNKELLRAAIIVLLSRKKAIIETVT